MAPADKAVGNMMLTLGPSAVAFDAIAKDFDSRFGAWKSVAAQRREVRAVLLREFPPGGRILELGGGTGEDAAFLAGRGFRIVHTDGSPTMVDLAQAKLARLGAQSQIAALEQMEQFARRQVATDRELFDGAFSNFAALNCVDDLRPTARGLARLLKPGAPAMLVLFGTFCPGEILVELFRGRPEIMFRRFRRKPLAARIAGREFQIVYHRRAALERAFAPWFELEKRTGIGIAVPTSAAEPWITQHPRLLAGMERADTFLSRPLAILGDHILYQLRRTKAV